MKFIDILKYVLFLGIGIGILYLMWQHNSAAYLEECRLRGSDQSDCSLWNKIKSDFSQANWFWIFIVLCIFMVSNVFRALRWNQLLKPLGYSPRFTNSLGTLMLGYFANLGIPRIGEFIRASSMSRYEQIPVEQTMATIIVGRIIDVILLLVFIGISFILSFQILADYFEANLPFSLATLVYIGIGLGIVGLLGLFSLYYFSSRYQTSENKVLKSLSNIISRFMQGLASIKDVENKSFFLFYSIGIWICYYLMTYLCFFAYEPTAHLGPIAGLVVFVFGTVGIVFPSPGGMGSYHYMVTQALIIYGIGGVEAFSFAMILFFAIQLFCNILFGLISLIGLPIYNNA